ncbi:WecB/TagA/CpsF family glycosyltransferase [Accumulibacter sp.]|uniref:WecB/TagA/CpsF family glycosyltransferase n=1 Tax=Accumulibacter sp. TaxID=2053492 RepID=UPI001AD24AF9|nr:WecB/TagA/CpsF family glycosyltransferase [Accumulibacter sp.]MBN8455064.1 WecB/TagA/CpsF family glycosyltransferase [Accumulibacter sp.]MBO3705868.1 WecB/TagA/CpsF family glycosyltransferase [Candidatus Accumulibacter conexus]
MTAIPGRETGCVLAAVVDAVDWDTAISRIQSWSAARESRYVCITNVHSVVAATHDPEHARILAGSDMATPDGAPVAWMLRRAGYRHQERINGPDLMWRYLAAAQRRGESIFLYGSTDRTLAALQDRLSAALPGLRIAGAVSPPFRDMSASEDAAVVDAINAAGAGTVWVSLGCPKQERWMAAHRGRVNAVMIGVGAAFDYHAGVLRRAPLWMRNLGLEWFHRLLSEPRRLWRRYLVTNTVFLLRAICQLTLRR